MMLAIETRYVVVVVLCCLGDAPSCSPFFFPLFLNRRSFFFFIRATSDLVIKKMIYLYLTSYARTHPELAQMCTNTLQKDCGNEDPMVRGLALRALCSLNLPSMVEYIGEPLRRGLSDGHAYVRKTAVMGVLKLHDLDVEAFESGGFVDVLYDILRDPDASVVCNCIIVLNEVMPNGMALNRAIMLHLLNRIHEFSEFAKVQVLELVPRYIPANEDEGFQIMNLLDPILSTSGSAAVMATMRAFLSLAEQIGDDLAEMRRQIVGRVKGPLVTQISSGSSEMMYSLLKHVEALAGMCPGVFDDEYRQFYVRYNEPTHVKYLKIGILPLLANPDNAPDIVSELAECVWDPNAKMSRLSIRSMARIACGGQGGPGAAEAIARRLVEMLDLNVDHVSSEAATALGLIVRKHPASKPLLAPPLVRSLKYMNEPSGKAALIYLIGECGELVDEAPYALEKLIDAYDDIEDAMVKQALLTSTVRLFFQRPPEVQRMLGRLLAKATDDVSSQDLHDRALLYYRLLRSGASDARSIESVVKTHTAISERVKFSEEDDDEMRAELMEEFDTLSIIYGKPSVNFIAPEFQVKYVKMPEGHPLGSSDVASLGSANNRPNAIPQNVGVYETPSAASGAPGGGGGDDVDLLGFGGGGAPSPPSATSTAQPKAPAAAALSLNPSVSMAGEAYQSTWSSIPDAAATVTAVPLSGLPTSTDEVESALSEKNVKIMASGELPNEFKFFFYAQDAAEGTLFLVQANIEKSTSDPLMIVTVKASGGIAGDASIAAFVELITQALN
jgi:vesicle coat complex subunit